MVRVRRLLAGVSSLVEHGVEALRLQKLGSRPLERGGFRTCGSGAQSPRGMWDSNLYPLVGRQVLIHCATREVLPPFF